MIRRTLTIAALGIAIAAAGSLTTQRAQAMPLGMPAAAADQLNMIDSVRLCFYVDGWNGPGMYECGFRHRHGMGWHGERHGGGGGRVEMHKGGGGGAPRMSGKKRR